MNERIKQLAEQAEKYTDDNFKGEPVWSEVYDQKFAELIVQECIYYAFCHGDDIAYVNKHFGIE
jgi:hypothetical protein